MENKTNFELGRRKDTQMQRVKEPVLHITNPL
mgnify:CR=1 FL=1